MKKFSFTALLIIIFVFLLEILSGYFYFFYDKNIIKSSKISLLNIPHFIKNYNFDRNLKKIDDLEFKDYKKLYDSNSLKLNNKNHLRLSTNPFFNLNAEGEILDKGYVYHPFIDFTNVHSAKYKFKKDYFGFRNSKDFFLENNNNFKIIITGGSECAGYTHKITIAEYLENEFKEYFKTKKIDVINLCMNSYTILNELQTYLHIGYNLKPDLIISHTGYNDALYSLFVPEKNFEHGLIYFIGHERWKNLINMETPRTFKELVNSNMVINFDPSLFFDVMNFNYKKYERIAKSNGVELIIGLQAHNKDFIFEKNNGQQYRKITNLNMNELNKKFKKINSYKINFFDFYDKLTFEDSVHTTTETSKLIARIYFDYILKNFGNIIVKKIND